MHETCRDCFIRASANDSIDMLHVTPLCHLAELMITSAAAPSLMLDAFAAVTVPPSL